MDKEERPYVHVSLPPPEWEEYIRRMKEKQEQEDLDEKRAVIIIDI